MEIAAYLQERKSAIDRRLAVYLDRRDGCPPRLLEAMRYSLLAGGKRLRGILCGAAAEAVGGAFQAALPCACALEMIHTFSLIHDDLPAMDNDDLRRGVPTSHKVFGEALAILAGDGLLAEAFAWLATTAEGAEGPDRAVMATVMREIAEATGGHGMVGGQVLDIAAEGVTLSPEAVAHLHALKTGALFRAAVTSGARLGGATAAQRGALTTYAERIGLAFQIADDLLAVEGSRAALGKPVGNDAARRKATYPATVGVAAARVRMTELTAAACEALHVFDAKADPLRGLARYMTERTH